MNPKHYAQMYAALERIKAYQSVARLRTHCARDWGVIDPNEAIEYAYENVLQEAKNGLRGVRRPSPPRTLRESAP